MDTDVTLLDVSKALMERTAGDQPVNHDSLTESSLAVPFYRLGHAWRETEQYLAQIAILPPPAVRENTSHLDYLEQSSVQQIGPRRPHQ